MRLGVGVLALFVVFAAAAPPARAQVSKEAAAEALFEEGRKLMADHHYAEAAAKFAASDRAAPSVGARINLGDCDVALEKTASAWTAYKTASNLASRLGDTRRARVAADRAAAVEPKLTYLVVAVPAASRVEGLTVEIDGAPTPEALWGQRLPIDPGDHPIEASASDRQPWSSTAHAGKPGTVVKIEIPVLEAVEKPVVETKTETKTEPKAGTEAQPETTTATKTTGSAGEPAPAATALDRGEPSDPGRTRRLVGLGVGAGGVVAVGLGLVVGYEARKSWNDAFDRGLCDSDTNVCNDEGQRLTEQARHQATASNIVVGAGLAVVTAGVILYLTAPDGDNETRTASTGPRLTPWASASSAGLGLSGSF